MKSACVGDGAGVGACNWKKTMSLLLLWLLLPCCCVLSVSVSCCSFARPIHCFDSCMTLSSQLCCFLVQLRSHRWVEVEEEVAMMHCTGDEASEEGTRKQQRLQQQQQQQAQRVCRAAAAAAAAAASTMRKLRRRANRGRMGVNEKRKGRVRKERRGRRRDGQRRPLEQTELQ